MGVVLKGFGHFIPDTSVSNEELAMRLGITEEYIIEKTGIAERKYYTAGSTSDMIIPAALDCIRQAGVSPGDIECVIVATSTPDYNCPSTAAIVHHKLGINNAAGFDLVAACSGYIFALESAVALISSKIYQNVLVCAGEKYSSVIDPMDRKTVLIGADGAGVSLLQYSEQNNDIVDTLCKLDSTNYLDVSIIIGGSAAPLTNENIIDGNRFLRFPGKKIPEKALECFKKVIIEIMRKNNLSFNDIDYIVPHQANKVMLETLADILNLPIEKFIINIEYIGNTGAASIPIAISEALRSGKLKGNEKLLLVAGGAGYTYAASLITLGNINKN